MLRVGGLEMWTDPTVKDKTNLFNRAENGRDFSSGGEKGSPQDREEKLETGINPG